MIQTQGKKVYVGLSGGVDSSVAAALLLRSGYDVTGVFMKNWSDTPDACTGDCGWMRERDDAVRVAAHLGVTFETFDFEDEYRRGVVDYMVREYAAGRTPNPDVMCNKLVKFDLFLKRALAAGADVIATGHYARRVTDENGVYHLLAGKDANKDQSYFLNALNQEQLGHSLFPVGDLQKADVRYLAREFGLPTANKKDSQGICFIGKVDLAGFLAGRIKQHPGNIVSMSGEIVGEHDGLAPYTIGQRHGMNLGGGDPYFVVRKDIATNTLVVSRDPNDLLSLDLFADETHWIVGQSPAIDFDCECRLRYRQPLQKCHVKVIDNGRLHVTFPEPQRAVAPGQFIVFYRSEECLGGAVIAE